MADTSFNRGYLVKCHQFLSGGQQDQSLNDQDFFTKYGEARGPREFNSTAILFDLHPVLWAAWPPWDYFSTYGYTVIDHWLDIDNPTAVYVGLIACQQNHQKIITLDDYIAYFQQEAAQKSTIAGKQFYVNAAVQALTVYRQTLVPPAAKVDLVKPPNAH